MNDIETNELDTICGLTDEELTERFKEEICIDNEIKRVTTTSTLLPLRVIIP